MHVAASCVKSKGVLAPASAVGTVQWGWVTPGSVQSCDVHEQSHDLPLISLLVLSHDLPFFSLLVLFPTSVCVNLSFLLCPSHS